jgi:hypothetical protein
MENDRVKYHFCEKVTCIQDPWSRTNRMFTM